MKKLGVVIVGLNGAVATTLIAGVELMVKGLVPRFGMLTEKSSVSGTDTIVDGLDMVPLEGFVFGGWDLRFSNTFEGALTHGVFTADKLAPVKSQLEKVTAWPAVVPKNTKLTGNIVKAGSMREQIAAIKQNVTDFKKAHGLDEVVMVNLMSTEPYLVECDIHKKLADFDKALDANDSSINASMLYLYAANELQVPYLNFTPSLSNVPALTEHAEKSKNPICGMDGKTGQTLLKTALASVFRLRRLFIEGWYSTNILGNNDGAVLADPESNKTKVMSKASVLDSIVGYPVENHQVHIHYYKPRGDSKEAWDNIDLQGFGGIPMQMKLDFLCQDSALAAPLVVDMVRFLAVAKAHGESGIQRQLSLFFKSPYAKEGETPEHDLFKQEQMLRTWTDKVANKAKR
ncbi:MAG: inositol-3-phosphate synthase [Polyangiaceae bacterium]